MLDGKNSVYMADIPRYWLSIANKYNLAYTSSISQIIYNYFSGPRNYAKVAYFNERKLTQSFLPQLKACRRFPNLFVVFVHFKRQVFLFTLAGILA